MRSRSLLLSDERISKNCLSRLPLPPKKARIKDKENLILGKFIVRCEIG
ncbi:Uncharacterized protein APZ42_023853 [Daphnia magna]|uniref:Uncharacterized protein n=1 Tax=Daphnia magna TaxID=35525 RepID=A0A164U791_9CRUS|nr:Uncharacterized protein APZ42_023853 [Daphnia magna]